MILFFILIFNFYLMIFKKDFIIYVILIFRYNGFVNLWVYEFCYEVLLVVVIMMLLWVLEYLIVRNRILDMV